MIVRSRIVKGGVIWDEKFCGVTEENRRHALKVLDDLRVVLECIDSSLINLPVPLRLTPPLPRLSGFTRKRARRDVGVVGLLRVAAAHAR